MFNTHEEVSFFFSAHAMRWRAGYRVLEGGADNDEVYTFSMFHYAVAGVAVRF
jgi:hypothetical protein